MTHCNLVHYKTTRTTVSGTARTSANNDQSLITQNIHSIRSDLNNSQRAGPICRRRGAACKTNCLPVSSIQASLIHNACSPRSDIHWARSVVTAWSLRWPTGGKVTSQLEHPRSSFNQHLALSDVTCATDR